MDEGRKDLSRRKAFALSDPTFIVQPQDILVVRAEPHNPGLVFLGASKKAAKTKDKRYVLGPGQTMPFAVSNSDRVFAVAERENCTVTYHVS